MVATVDIAAAGACCSVVTRTRVVVELFLLSIKEGM